MNNPVRSKLSDENLLKETFDASKKEKQATFELLKYLVQVDERRAYATLDCSSLFEYVVKVLGFSETQASERVNSVRLKRAVPEAEDKIKNGSLSMTTASQIHRFSKQEKKAGNVVTKSETLEIIETCSSQSKREVEKILFSKASAEAKEAQEKIREVSEDLTELRFYIPEATFKKLNEVRNLLGNESLKDIFAQALDSLIQEKRRKKGMVLEDGNNVKPCDQTASTAIASSTAESNSTSKLHPSTLPAKEKFQKKIQSRFISIHTKRIVSQRSGNRCEYINPKTKMRCSSQYKLELDHEFPFALGGNNEASNLTHKCRQHNLKAAEEWGLCKS